MLSTQAEANRLTQAQQMAWGTSGLKPVELRAISHAVGHVVSVTGKPAAQFKEQLRAKVRELPPYEAPTGAAVPKSGDVLRL